MPTLKERYDVRARMKDARLVLNAREPVNERTFTEEELKAYHEARARLAQLGGLEVLDTVRILKHRGFLLL